MDDDDELDMDGCNGLFYMFSARDIVTKEAKILLGTVTYFSVGDLESNSMIPFDSVEDATRYAVETLHIYDWASVSDKETQEYPHTGKTIDRYADLNLIAVQEVSLSSFDIY